MRHHFHNPKHPSVLPFLSHFTSSLTMRTDSDDDSDFVSPSTLVGGGNVRRVDIINESDGDFEGSVVSRSPPVGTSDIVENPKHRLK